MLDLERCRCGSGGGARAGCPVRIGSGDKGSSSCSRLLVMRLGRLRLCNDAAPRGWRMSGRRSVILAGQGCSCHRLILLRGVSIELRLDVQQRETLLVRTLELSLLVATVRVLRGVFIVGKYRLISVQTRHSHDSI